MVLALKTEVSVVLALARLVVTRALKEVVVAGKTGIVRATKEAVVSGTIGTAGIAALNHSVVIRAVKEAAIIRRLGMAGIAAMLSMASPTARLVLATKDGTTLVIPVLQARFLQILLHLSG